MGVFFSVFWRPRNMGQVLEPIWEVGSHLWGLRTNCGGDCHATQPLRLPFAYQMFPCNRGHLEVGHIGDTDFLLELLLARPRKKDVSDHRIEASASAKVAVRQIHWGVWVSTFSRLYDAAHIVTMLHRRRDDAVTISSLSRHRFGEMKAQIWVTDATDLWAYLMLRCFNH